MAKILDNLSFHSYKILPRNFYSLNNTTTQTGPIYRIKLTLICKLCKKIEMIFDQFWWFWLVYSHLTNGFELGGRRDFLLVSLYTMTSHSSVDDYLGK